MPRSSLSRSKTRTKAIALAAVITILAVIGGTLLTLVPSRIEAKGLAGRFSGVTGRYESRVQAIQQEADAVRTEGELGEVLRVFGQLRDATREAIHGYAGLPAPEVMKGAQGSAVAILEKQMVILDGIILDARRDDQSGVDSGFEELLTTSAALRSAVQEMERLILECGDPCK